MKEEKVQRMNESIAQRVDLNDQRTLEDIVGAREFHSFCAGLLPKEQGARILDLSCETGIELEYCFRENETAEITVIGLTEEMSQQLKQKFPDKKLDLFCCSCLDWNFPARRFNAAIAVESLHNIEPEARLSLYRRLCSSLKDHGCFILAGRFAESPELSAEDFHHNDMALTLENELEILQEAGFRRTDVMGSRGATYVIKAMKHNSFRVDIAGNNRAHGLIKEYFAPGDRVFFSVMTATDTSYYITSDQVRIETHEYSVGGLSWFFFTMPEMDVRVNIRSENTMTALNREPPVSPERKTGRSFCPECGGEIHDDLRFCPNCGRKLR